MKKLALLSFVLITTVFFTTACEKDNSERYGIRVHVVNEAGVGVPNAAVELFAPVPRTLLSETDSTDLNGYAFFEYDQASAAVARATKGPNGGVIWVGCNEKTLQEGTEVEIRVVVRQRPDTTVECDI